MLPLRSVFQASRNCSSAAVRNFLSLPQLPRIWLPRSMSLSHLSSRHVHSGRGSGSSASHTAPVVTPELLPFDEPIDEERLPRYDARDYYPANPGDVLDDKYQLVAKLGWGSNSTVWLAEVISGYRSQRGPSCSSGFAR